MCGIFGMVGTLEEKNYSEAHLLLSNIFKASQRRGRDSSGFSAIHLDKPGQLITDKRPISSSKYVDRCDKFKALKRNMPNILIGHTRASTSGNPSRNRNNHPFNGRRYTLVHNGGIKDWQRAVDKLSVNMRTETDSEILLHLLERSDDPHNSVQEIIDDVGYGSRIAIAAIDYSLDRPRLLVFRNDSNDIYVMTHTGFNVMFFASTKAILMTALDESFGAYATEHVEMHKVDIDRTESFLSQEIGVNKDDGAPYVISEKPIKKPHYSSQTLPTTSSFSSSSSKTNVQRKLGFSENKTTSVFSAIKDKNVSNETRKDLLRLTKVIRCSGEILKSIRSNMFMTPEEIKDYEEWKKIV